MTPPNHVDGLGTTDSYVLPEEVMFKEDDFCDKDHGILSGLHLVALCTPAHIESHDEYPSAEDLRKINEWPHEDVHGLLDFIAELWHYPDWGWREYAGREGDDDTRVILASTGGWSGNEDLMEAFRHNFLAYHQAFESYRRGGHYQLALPKRKP